MGHENFWVTLFWHFCHEGQMLRREGWLHGGFISLDQDVWPSPGRVYCRAWDWHGWHVLHQHLQASEPHIWQTVSPRGQCLSGQSREVTHCKSVISTVTAWLAAFEETFSEYNIVKRFKYMSWYINKRERERVMTGCKHNTFCNVFCLKLNIENFCQNMCRNSSVSISCPCVNIIDQRKLNMEVSFEILVKSIVFFN